jgi:hypothetical protein
MKDGIIRKVIEPNIQWCKDNPLKTIPVGRLENILVFLQLQLIFEVEKRFSQKQYAEDNGAYQDSTITYTQLIKELVGDKRQ